MPDIYSLKGFNNLKPNTWYSALYFFETKETELVEGTVKERVTKDRIWLGSYITDNMGLFRTFYIVNFL